MFHFYFFNFYLHFTFLSNLQCSVRCAVYLPVIKFCGFAVCTFVLRIFFSLSSGISDRSGGEIQEGHGIQRPARQWKVKPHLPSGYTQRRFRGDGRANVRAAQGNRGEIKGSYAKFVISKKKCRKFWVIWQWLIRQKCCVNGHYCMQRPNRPKMLYVVKRFLAVSDIFIRCWNPKHKFGLLCVNVFFSFDW